MKSIMFGHHLGCCIYLGFKVIEEKLGIQEDGCIVLGLGLRYNSSTDTTSTLQFWVQAYQSCEVSNLLPYLIIITIWPGENYLIFFSSYDRSPMQNSLDWPSSEQVEFTRLNRSRTKDNTGLIAELSAFIGDKIKSVFHFT